jgi:tetratricopeptide (TPR) repeat protein
MRTIKIFLILALGLSFVYCTPTQKKIEADNERNPQYQYEKAIVAVNYGLTDQAAKYLNQAISLDPNHHPSYSLLGRIHFTNGEYRDAAIALEKSLELGSDTLDTYFYLGDAYQKLEQFNEAEEAFLKADGMESEFRTSLRLAELYFEQGKLEKALQYTKKAIQKNDRDANIYNLQGVILNKLNQLPEAIESFQRALKITPDNIVIIANVGIAYVNMKDFKKAQEIFENILPRIEDQTLKSQVEGYLKKLKELR